MIKHFSFILFALLLFSQHVFANGPVWKVSNGKSHLFIGGTIHLLSPQDYPLPYGFEQAYQKSQALVFEMDPDLASSPEAQQLFMEKAIYRDGRTLASVLDKDVYQSLEGFLASRNIPIESLHTMKPSLLTVVLSVMELQRMGIVSAGVDEFYNDKAKQDDKPRYFLETLEEQLAALLAIGEGLENETVLHILDEMDRMKETMDSLMSAWRQGDNRQLAKVGFEKWPAQFPELYQALVVKRNQRWIPQIEEMLKSSEIEYVLVGALHLAGDDSVLRMLKDKGYQVEKLAAP